MIIAATYILMSNKIRLKKLNVDQILSFASNKAKPYKISL